MARVQADLNHKSSSEEGPDEDGIRLYRDEIRSCTIPDHSRPTVSLQLPEKVWYIDGKLVLTNMRLIFLPQSIRGDFFPAVFRRDSPAQLCIYLAGVDHLVLVQGQRRTKLRAFSTKQPGALLGGQVDKLEVHCCDYTRYRFCFNSPHRQRRGLLDRLNNGGGSLPPISSFSLALRASIIDLQSRATGSGPASPRAYRVDQSDSVFLSPQAPDAASDTAKFLSNLCLFAFCSRRDAAISAVGLFACRRVNYADYLLRKWSAGDRPVADVTLRGGCRVILPLLPGVAAASLSREEVEYYRDNGHPRLVLVFSVAVAVLRSAQPKGRASGAGGPTRSLFFKQSIEFETHLQDRFTSVELFDCDRMLPSLKAVRGSRRSLLHHCVITACCDPISLDKIRAETESGFLSGLETTRWLRWVHACLDYAAMLARRVHIDERTVWLLEGSDRDWNCLMASLMQLMLCPETRCLEGFEQLVRLEWVSRHPFRARLLDLSQQLEGDADQSADSQSEQAGSAAAPGSSGENTSSPLFLLFLDCVWQLTCRYPSCFEMSSVYLTLLHDVVQWPVFQENAFASVDEVLFGASSGDAARAMPGSLFDWSAYVTGGVRGLFVNRLYRPSRADPPDYLHRAWLQCEIQFWAENYGRNARFAASEAMVPGYVYAEPAARNLGRDLDRCDGRPIAAPTRSACFYGDEGATLNFGSPFGWSAGLIVEELLRNHLKEVGGTQQLDPRALQS